MLDDVAIFVFFLVFFDLDSKLKSKFVEPLELIVFPHELKEPLPFNFDVGHVDTNIWKKIDLI